MTKKSRHTRRPDGIWSTVSHCVRVGALLAILVPLAACDSLDNLLEADLPGRVVDEALSDPALAPTLVAGAQANFECALQGHILGIEAGWAQAFQYVIFQIEMIRIASRNDRVIEVGQGECTSNRDPIWFIMHRARYQAADAIDRIQNEMPAGSVEGEHFLLGKAYAYEGYATEFLAEAWCNVIFDGSEELVPREDAMALAEARFTSALDHAQQGLSGPYSTEAQDIVDLALVGRARSRLNQGDLAGALADAQAVSPGFVYYATYDDSPSRRENMVQRLEDGFVVHPSFRELTVQGVPDPRVPTEMIGTHPSGVDWWIQRKYLDTGTDIPFASWREAQLMIAEIEGGQTAIDILNELRANPHGLPSLSAEEEANIGETVQEERRRELFLQGTKIGDDLRTGNHETWDTGVSPVNAPYGDNTCIPVPEIEFL